MDTLSQMFPIMLKPREICKFIQGDSMFPVVTWENKTKQMMGRRVKMEVGDRD